MRRFSLRTLMILTLLAAAVMMVIVSMRAKPRQYSSLADIIRRHASDRSISGAPWEIHIAPDIDGPFRIAGDDWVSHGMLQSNAGENVHGWVDSGPERRPFNVTGIPGVSFLVVPLENSKDKVACLVLKR